MELYGVTLDFDDMRSCGLLPDLCADWDHRSEELTENEKLLSYWDNNIKELLKKTDKVILGNIGNKSVLYSADENTVQLIKEQFKEMELSKIMYEEIDQCENCIKVDYLNP
ncbi:MAG: hypothetical protein C0625_14195 [Arcobacter sp.]|nr:MAG: hypothetical protein C0625_14195 [Arcobacter sp.]